jgi:Ca2+:H+ antiporter
LQRNAVELIVAIIALAKKEIIIVQTSLIGSMLSNLLLVMGMCFFFGGINRMEQYFNTTVAQTAASLLALAVASLVIPTAYIWGNPNFVPSESSNDEELSRGTSIILLVVYASYLIFQLKSHKDMYNESSPKVEKRKSGKSMKRALAHMGGLAGATAGGNIQQEKIAQNKPKRNDHAEEPTLTFFGAIVTLCVATALIGVCSEFLVDSISDVTCQNNISPYFVGLILLPIVYVDIFDTLVRAIAYKS